MGVTPAMSGLSGLSGMVGGGGGPVFTPASLSNLRQYALDGGSAYESAALGGFEVLRSLEPYGTYRQPRQGRAWLFDGTDDVAITPVAPSGYTGISFGGWVKVTAVGNYPMIMSYGSIGSGNTSIELRLLAATGQAEFVNIASNLGCIHPVNLNGAGWTHLLGTSDGTTLKLYINGALVDTDTVTTNLNTIVPFRIGNRADGTNLPFSGSMRDMRIYSRVLTLNEVIFIHTNGASGTNPTTSNLVAQYPCNEESGTVGYDISGNGNHATLTNITQSTFHATDTGVSINRNNSDGYRLSGSVYIPKRLSDANAADGNALTVTGQSPYPINVEVPCITGNGGNVFADLGSPLIPATANFSISIWYQHGASGSTIRGVLGQYTPNSLGLFANNARLDALQMFISPDSGAGVNVYTPTSTLVSGKWHYITFTRVGDVFTTTVTVDEVTTNIQSTGSGAVLGQGNTTIVGIVGVGTDGSVADLRITTSGVTTHFPLQDGPGSSNTNRDLSYIKSDGTYGVVAGAIVNGTVSTIWGNRCPLADDWCSKYGGDIAANGAFLPGQISGSLASDGTAKTLTAGKFGNPYSRINFNPFTAAELNGLNLESAYAVTTARQSVAPTDTKFRRTKADGDDRFFTTAAALTGSDKTNAEAYIA